MFSYNNLLHLQGKMTNKQFLNPILFIYFNGCLTLLGVNR